MNRRTARAVVAIAAVFLTVTAAAQVNWPNGNTYTPVPGPPGGNPNGDFEYRQGTDNSQGFARPIIEIRFRPKPGGVTCAPTAIVQTVSDSFINNDGSKESLTKPSDMYKGTDEESAKKKKKAEETDDPVCVNGRTVDHSWSDKDPYYNGDDDNDQKQDMDGNSTQGTQTKPASFIDGPLLGPAWFTGTRKTLVREFEACAYCMNKDGTLGQVLGCVTWKYEQTKDPPGTITPPTGSSAKPSKAHEDAAAKFVERHTRTVGGTTTSYCPEFEQSEINRAAELNKRAQETEDQNEKERLRREADEIMKRIRTARGG